MSGSIHYFDYKSDAGTDYFVRMDKSNGLVVGNVQLASNTRPGVPRNIEPRYAIYRSLDRKVTRKIIIGSNAANVVSTLPQTFSDPAISATGSSPVYLSAFVPERTKLASVVDTGLLT